MKRKTSKIIFYQIFLSILVLTACNNGQKHNNDGSNGNNEEVAFSAPATPDSSTYLKVANFLSDEEVDNIIDQETKLSNGKTRNRGIKPVPQDGDDFRRAMLMFLS